MNTDEGSFLDDDFFENKESSFNENLRRETGLTTTTNQNNNEQDNDIGPITIAVQPGISNGALTRLDIMNNLMIQNTQVLCQKFDDVIKNQGRIIEELVKSNQLRTMINNIPPKKARMEIPPAEIPVDNRIDAAEMPVGEPPAVVRQIIENPVEIRPIIENPVENRPVAKNIMEIRPENEPVMSINPIVEDGHIVELPSYALFTSTTKDNTDDKKKKKKKKKKHGDGEKKRKRDNDDDEDDKKEKKRGKKA